MSAGLEPRRDAAAVRTDEALLAARLATYLALVALAVLAWRVSQLRMSGMDAGPGSQLGTFGFFIITWVVMMAAMMFPSVAPMVATFVSIQRGRRRKGMLAHRAAVPLFVTGYLISWTAFGLVAYVIVRLPSVVGHPSITWDGVGRWLAAGVLFAAALYEITPLKGACLTRCRGPLTFILTTWRDGRFGAMTMGIRHGLWCVGCCWGLMAALFALGVMSLPWMALVGLLIALEKLLPWRRTAVVVVAGLLVALALGVAASPHHVPGLTIPGQQSMPMN